ncbi:hypothetical protein CF326_g1192 [Tilletia indica]|nr:hypothetical protein CF326_g1192 [Tilletia indica]
MSLQKSLQYAAEEDKLQCALEEAQSVAPKKPNIASLAKKHGVDEQRLRRRFQGRHSRSTRPPANRKLSNDQENAILAWIHVLDTLELAARPSLIEASANQLLREGHTDSDTLPPTVGENWVRNFIWRHPDLALVKQKSQELLRMSHDKNTCAKFFHKLKEVIAEHGISPDDIWNMDEIGFRIGIGGQQWIVTLCSSREARIASSTSRESVTCVEAVSAKGEHIAPLIIISGSQHSESWAQNSLPSEALIAVNDSGYSDDMLALRWIQHFADRTKKMTRGQKRLLIFDGHGSHCTRQFIQICTENDIIPFTLPPHSSHFLQPLDVSVFQPYKHWHKEAVDQATRTGCGNFGKTEFLAALNSIRIKTFKTGTIQSGFRRTGIHPFRPSEVLRRFDTETSAPIFSSSPPGSPAPAAPTTPQTIRSLKRAAETIEERTEELSPLLRRQVQAFVRGSMQQAQTGALAVKGLEEQTAAQKERDKRKERQRRVTQSGGVLSLEEAREICQDKLDKEKREQARREWTLLKKAAAKRKAEGWGKIYAEMRRKVKKLQKGAAEALAEALFDSEEDAEEETENVLSEDDFGEVS